MKNKKFLIIGIVIVILVAIGIGVYFLLKNNNTNNYLVELNKNALQEKIDNKDSFILVVSREGCPHCAEYLPVLRKVLENNKVTAYLVDIAKFSKEDRTYLNSIANVSGTPTTLFIEKGEEKSVVNRIVGSTDRRSIESRLKATGYIE